MTSLRIEVIRDARALASASERWDRLVEQAGVAHPFVGHDWIMSWWEAFGEGNELRTLLVYDQDELIGIAPLMISRTKIYGLPVREMGFIYNDHTPRFDFIIAEKHAAFYQAVWQHLHDTRAEWDVLKLCQLVADSPTLPELAQLKYLTGTWPSTESPYLAVRGSFEQHLATLPRGVRANLRRRQKRLEEMGTLDFECLTDADQLDGALDEAFQMEAESWKGAAGSAIACRDEFKRFYQGIARRALASGTLYLTFLCLNGRRIAFDLSLIYKNRLFKLKPGYAMEFHSCSPGAQLTQLTVRNAFERGLDEVDFLGNADAWKLDWTKTTRQNYWTFVFRPNLRGLLLYYAKFKFLPWWKSRSLAKSDAMAEAA